MDVPDDYRIEMAKVPQEVSEHAREKGEDWNAKESMCPINPNGGEVLVGRAIEPFYESIGTML